MTLISQNCKINNPLSFIKYTDSDILLDILQGVYVHDSREVETHTRFPAQIVYLFADDWRKCRQRRTEVRQVREIIKFALRISLQYGQLGLSAAEDLWAMVGTHGRVVFSIQ